MSSILPVLLPPLMACLRSAIESNSVSVQPSIRQLFVTAIVSMVFTWLIDQVPDSDLMQCFKEHTMFLVRLMVMPSVALSMCCYNCPAFNTTTIFETMAENACNAVKRIGLTGLCLCLTVNVCFAHSYISVEDWACLSIVVGVLQWFYLDFWPCVVLVCFFGEVACITSWKEDEDAINDSLDWCCIYYISSCTLVEFQQMRECIYSEKESAHTKSIMYSLFPSSLVLLLLLANMLKRDIADTNPWGKWILWTTVTFMQVLLIGLGLQMLYHVH